jgi:hypothetical protein
VLRRVDLRCWSFDADGDADRATRLTVQDGDFAFLEVRGVDL